MTTTSSWVSGAIREARERRGWSQSELARRLAKTQTAVSYWESGKRSPGIDDLMDLAAVLDVTVDTFFPPERTRRPVTAVLRATAARLVDSELGDAIDGVLEMAEANPLPAPRISVPQATSPTHVANALLETAGVTHPPVDIGDLAAACGALVVFRPFPDSLSGLVFEYEGAAVIGVNLSHHPNRRRFSLAHELGHYLLGHHRGSQYEDRFHLDISEGTPPGFDYQAERLANEFAAEILMPRRFISHAFQQTPDPKVLAAMFEVSQIAIGYRLVNLGLG